MGTYLLVLCVSLEQENAIQNMFSEKNWSFHKIGMLYTLFLWLRLMSYIQTMRYMCSLSVILFGTLEAIFSFTWENILLILGK